MESYGFHAEIWPDFIRFRGPGNLLHSTPALIDRKVRPILSAMIRAFEAAGGKEVFEKHDEQGVAQAALAALAVVRRETGWRGPLAGAPKPLPPDTPGRQVDVAAAIRKVTGRAR